MKKFLAVILSVIMILSMAACNQDPGKETDPMQTTESTPTDTTGSEFVEGEMITGLEVTVFKVIDRSNVVVRFNQDRWGYTDTPNYKIVDQSGKEYALESCNSAFWDMGGETPNVFKMVFAEPLPVGNYTITVSNITDAISGPYHTYEPCQTMLIITEDVGEGVQAGAVAEDIGEIAIDIHMVVDNSTIIVHFDKECVGCTDVPNYVVTNASGEEVEVVSAESAFVELGGTTPNVFKLTFAEPLAAGTYTVTATNMASTTATDSIYPDASVEFTI